MNLDDIYAPTTVEKEYQRTVYHMEFVREYWDEVSRIKELLANDQIEAARGVFMDLDENIRIGLWRATTKGGCWTVKERELLRPHDLERSWRDE